jgi:hypothetical protein
VLDRNDQKTTTRYASDRVFDGIRPLSAARIAKLRANYRRSHTTAVFRFVAKARRFLGFSGARRG